MAETITIGNQSDSRITAFGDDSKYHRTNVFSYVIFENTNLALARSMLHDVKSHYKIPDNVLLHMRVLTNAKQRKKCCIDHLTQESIFQLVSEIIDRMNEIPFLVKASYYSGDLPENVVDPQFGITWSDKAMQSMLAKDALIPFKLQQYSYSDLRIMISRDATMTSFIGSKGRQAHRWARGFSNIDAPAGLVYEFDPPIGEPKEEILLQLADVMVYVIAHCVDAEKPSLPFQAALSKVRNIDVKQFGFIPAS